MLYNGSITDNKTLSYEVTVEAKTAEHNSYGSGSTLGYKFGDNFTPYLTLTPGNTYIFDQSDSSNLNHPLLFYLDADKQTPYTDNVTTSGIPGVAGAYTKIKITSSTPETLHYQCSNHNLMGDSLWTNLGSATADSNGEFSITASTLSEGSYSLTATATDAAGNVSSASSSLSLTVNALFTQLSDLQALTYIASYPDLIAAFGADTTAANNHYNNLGKSEGRNLDTFNVTQYLANYSDLTATFGANTSAALQHYISSGFAEGRTYRTLLSTEQAWSYLASNGDLINSFGANPESAIAHYQCNGDKEGRNIDTLDEWR